MGLSISLSDMGFSYLTSNNNKKRKDKKLLLHPSKKSEIKMH